MDVIEGALLGESILLVDFVFINLCDDSNADVLRYASPLANRCELVEFVIAHDFRHSLTAACGRVFWIQLLEIVFVLFVCHSIVAVRVYAIYERSRLVGWM